MAHPSAGNAALPLPEGILPQAVPHALLHVEQPGDVAFILKLGSALHRYGAPAHRVEGLLTEVSAKLGIRAQFFSTLTFVFVSFGAPEELRCGLSRVEPSDLDLGRLSDLDALTERIIRAELTTAEGAEQLDALLAAPERYGVPAVLLCHVLAAAAGARLFGGGWKEALVAGAIGLIVGPLGLLGRGDAARGQVVELVAALCATLVAAAAAQLFGPLSIEVSTIAGLIILLPGLSLTIALTEVATRNLISGTSRLMAAALVFLELAFGVGLGGKLAGFLFPRPATVTPPTPPAWTMIPAIVIVGLSVVVLFRARVRDIGWVLLAGVIAYGGARIGTHVLGPELGAFIGALGLGTFSNFVSARFGRPGVVTSVPGLITLVPGSIGFRSLESLLQRDVVTGIGTAFTMILVGIAIVAGLLLANAVLRPRKVL